jgi:calcineurin-like phosphoesterase family protein
MPAFDVIGDVHAHASRLEALLRRLGYEHRDGAWRHRERVAVFVGDLIDRGPEQLATLRLVRSMVDAGSARIVLGNHEFDACAWDTCDVERSAYCRSHSTEHRDQHGEFLAEVVENSERHHEWVAWFESIPLWLDLGGLRIVHACWDEASIDVVTPLASVDDSLTEELVIAASRKPTADERAGPMPPYVAIDILLTGPELYLGGDRGYVDKDGHASHHVRFSWWDQSATTLDRGAVIPPDVRSLDGGEFPELDAEPIKGHGPVPYTDDTPVIFGHYGCNAGFQVLGPKTICVDFSAGNGGPIAAYRWDGEPDLSPDNLVCV